MKNCPKCGSPQVEEQTNYAKETGRTWWVCGTFQTRDCHPHHSELCLEREEKNTLQRKVEELQVALDFAIEAVDQRERSRKETEAKLDDLQASTIHSCGDSCSRPMCVLRRERDTYKESLKYIHSICEDKTIELPDDDYAKATIDECIMEAERAMQKCKKMEGEAK